MAWNESTNWRVPFIPVHHHRLWLLCVRINAKIYVEVTRFVIWQGIESSWTLYDIHFDVSDTKRFCLEFYWFSTQNVTTCKFKMTSLRDLCDHHIIFVSLQIFAHSKLYKFCYQLLLSKNIFIYKWKLVYLWKPLLARVLDTNL